MSVSPAASRPTRLRRRAPELPPAAIGEGAEGAAAGGSPSKTERPRWLSCEPSPGPNRRREL